MSLMSSTRWLAHSRSLVACSETASHLFSSLRRTNDNGGNKVSFQPVYVNHLSKLVLEHLQNSKQDWLVRRGLDRGLRINVDGTFVLRFPLNEEGREIGRIWTSIDPSTKQHHLSVFRGSLIAQYGLKDLVSLASKDRIGKESTKSRVTSIVDEMVQTLDEIDGIDLDKQATANVEQSPR